MITGTIVNGVEVMLTRTIAITPTMLRESTSAIWTTWVATCHFLYGPLPVRIKTLNTIV